MDETGYTILSELSQKNRYSLLYHFLPMLSQATNHHGTLHDMYIQWKLCRGIKGTYGRRESREREI